MSAIGGTDGGSDNYGNDKDFAGVGNNPSYDGGSQTTVESSATYDDGSSLTTYSDGSRTAIGYDGSTISYGANGSRTSTGEPVGFNETYAANSRYSTVDVAKLQNAVPTQSSQPPNFSPEDTKNFAAKAYDGRIGDKFTMSNGIETQITDVRIDPETGFRAAVFTDSLGNKNISIAGTEMTSWADWKANAYQSVGGVPRQYEQGLALAREYQAAYGDKVSLTGHSLGGGIATYASINTGLPAVGINAAPLGRGTYTAEQRVNPALTDQIRQYAAQGEILTDLAANPVFGGLLGNTIPGERISVPAANREVPSIPFTPLDDFYNLGVSIKNHLLGNTAPAN